MRIDKRRVSIIGCDTWIINLDMEAITEAVLEKYVPAEHREDAEIVYTKDYDDLPQAEVKYDDYSNPSQR